MAPRKEIHFLSFYLVLSSSLTPFPPFFSLLFQSKQGTQFRWNEQEENIVWYAAVVKSSFMSPHHINRPLPYQQGSLVMLKDIIFHTHFLYKIFASLFTTFIFFLTINRSVKAKLSLPEKVQKLFLNQNPENFLIFRLSPNFLQHTKKL